MIHIILLGAALSCGSLIGQPATLVERLKRSQGVLIEAKTKHHYPIMVKRTADQFSVIAADYEQGVQSCFVDKLVKEMSPKALAAAVNHGQLSLVVDQAPDGSARITAKPKLKGGGIIAGNIAYWATKGVIYGGVLAGIAWNIRNGNTGSADVSPSPNMEMFQDLAATAAIEAAEISMGPVAPVIAVGISHCPEAAKMAGEGSAAIISTGVVAVTETIGWVESAAAWAGAVFTAIPWLP